MTRSITITNTSNWDREDYLVEGIPYKAQAVRLRPGESVTFTPEREKDENGYSQADAKLRSLELEEAGNHENARPFIVPNVVDSQVPNRTDRKDKQVMPRVKVIWE